MQFNMVAKKSDNKKSFYEPYAVLLSNQQQWSLLTR